MCNQLVYVTTCKTSCEVKISTFKETWTSAMFHIHEHYKGTNPHLENSCILWQQIEWGIQLQVTKGKYICLFGNTLYGILYTLYIYVVEEINYYCLTTGLLLFLLCTIIMFTLIQWKPTLPYKQYFLSLPNHTNSLIH